MHNESWDKIFHDNNLNDFNFDKDVFVLTSGSIKKSCQDFRRTGEKEVRILCKQDTRESRPDIFKKLGLFLLPIKNGEYIIIKGEGYIDVPDIPEETSTYTSKLDFPLDTAKIGDSEMQHLDFAYASSLIRSFMQDDSLVLTIRGRKYTPKEGFKFHVGNHQVEVTSVQTEVDAGYEGRDKVVLIEAKNSNKSNIIIRQLFYPFNQWGKHSHKKIVPLFFEKKNDEYRIWQFDFDNHEDYNSIYLTKGKKYKIK
jgi:hypothetical protein